MSFGPGYKPQPKSHHGGYYAPPIAPVHVVNTGNYIMTGMIPVAGPVVYYGLLVRNQYEWERRRQQQLQEQAQRQAQYAYNQAVQQAAAQVAAFMPLPLQAVHVQAQVFDFCAEVTVTQTYTNHSPFVLESEYIFPLDENSAVCGFKAELNGRVINGLVKEKSEAKREFLQAKAQGKSTMLLEQKKENCFKISIGNLEANTSCKITLTYITTLDLEGKSNRMVIPAVVAPKYEPHAYWGWDGYRNNSGEGNNMSGFNGPAQVQVQATPSTGMGQLGFFQSMTAQYMGVPVAVPVVVPVVQPEITVAVKQQRQEPQRFSMAIELLMPSEILSITSETHQSQIQVQVDPIVAVPSAENGDRLPVPQHAKVLFGMNLDGSAPSAWPENLGSKDFVLTIAQKQFLETRAVLEVDPVTGSQAVQLAFCPQSMDLLDASALQTEILFLIDQSGSMGGSAIQSVKACLDIFLRSLPVACRFNLISFGSTYRMLFPTSQPYNEVTINTALQYVSKISADLGGTEILDPLRYCFSAQGDVAYPRQIFLLTDGQVSNTQELVDLTRKYNHTSRVFTFGLGGSVDRHLVKSLAEAGGGECEFVSGASTPEAKKELNAKIMRNLVRAMQPALTDIKVSWPGQVDIPTSGPNVAMTFFGGMLGMNLPVAKQPTIQCPSSVAPIFPPNREMVYALNIHAPLPVQQGIVPGSQPDLISYITVSAHSNRPMLNGQQQMKSQGRVEWKIPLNLSRPQSGTFIHKLAARARIGELQNSTKINSWRNNQEAQAKAEILSLALKYQLLSNYTSFIIVDDRKIKKKKIRKPKPAVVPPVVMNAQVNMFNAFLSNQMNPGMPVNQNGYAFQEVGKPAVAPVVAPVQAAAPVVAPVVASAPVEAEPTIAAAPQTTSGETAGTTATATTAAAPVTAVTAVSGPITAVSSFASTTPAPSASASSPPVIVSSGAEAASSDEEEEEGEDDAVEYEMNFDDAAAEGDSRGSSPTNGGMSPRCSAASASSSLSFATPSSSSSYATPMTKSSSRSSASFGAAPGGGGASYGGSRGAPRAPPSAAFPSKPAASYGGARGGGGGSGERSRRSAGGRQVHHDEDEALDDMSEVLDSLSMRSSQISMSLSQQDAMLDSIDDKTDRNAAPKSSFLGSIGGLFKGKSEKDKKSAEKEMDSGASRKKAGGAPVYDMAASPSSQKLAPSHPTSAVSASSSIDVLFTELLQQNSVADSTWSLSNELLTLIQMILQKSAVSDATKAVGKKLTMATMTSLATSLSVSEKAIATLLVLWVLSQCFADRDGEYMMMTSKAKGAIRNQGLPVDRFEEVTKKIVE